ncbi:MAG: S9 family peptidase [Proteobacteria bacterium]|nr:S9 family peptidase [Pseudomonadota bacterium]
MTATLARLSPAILLLGAIIAGSAIAAEPESQAGLRPLALADGGRIRYPGPPRISRDGKQIVFSEDGTIYLVSRTENEPLAISTSSSSAWDPHWSRDGNHLYFVSDRSESRQIWKLAIDKFGEATQVTSLEQGISATSLSPDESQVLLSFSDDELRSETKDDDELPGPFVVTRRQFKRDADQGYITEGGTQHIYVYDVESETLRQVTSGTYDESDAAWSPDGNSIVFVSNREDEPDASYRSDIWIVSLSGNNIQPVRLTNNENNKYSPVFSPDGTKVAYLTAGDGVYSVPHIAIVPVTGGKPTILTMSVDRWISSFQFSDNGQWLYFNFDNGGSTHVARVRVDDGTIERIVEGDVTVSAFDVGPNSTLALNLSRKNTLPDVHVLEGKRLTKLTDLNRKFLDEVLIGEQRKASFPSKDGTIVEAFITTPADYEKGKSYPTILDIHGGPVGQYAWGYSFSAQFFAANGYVVVEPNPRGSSGFGEDYIRAIYRTWGITDYDDVIASVDYAVEQGIADPDRLAVTGYSYGGYMTNVVITETDRFKAAASGAGHSLIEANFGHDIYQQWYMWELGVPWENREKYDRLSPFLRAGRIKTPTIFLGGRIDWNVPIINAELMYQAMKVQGIDTELVVYPDAHHGGWPAEYETDYLERVVAWFDRYAKN